MFKNKIVGTFAKKSKKKKLNKQSNLQKNNKHTKLSDKIKICYE